MKPFGSVLAFTRERNVALMKLYRGIIRDIPFVNLSDVCRQIADSPAPRFWVSEERAATVVSAIMRGVPVLDSMRGPKREMFSEIFRRALLLKEAHPKWPLSRIVAKVVNSPAPKFYMHTSSVRLHIFKLRKSFRNAQR